MLNLRHLSAFLKDKNTAGADANTENEDLDTE